MALARSILAHRLAEADAGLCRLDLGDVIMAAQTIEAVFDGEVFRPEHAMSLVPHRRYRITMTDIGSAEGLDA